MAPPAELAFARRLGVELFLKHGGGYVLTAPGSKAASEPKWPELAKKRAQNGKADALDWSAIEPGLVPGERLADIDIDHPRALLALPYAKYPPTALVWGRASKRRSHLVYALTLPAEPFEAKHGSAARIVDEKEKQGIIEFRTGWGRQSKGPGGLHPSGEVYEFDESGDPGLADTGDLIAATYDHAAMTLLGIVWPSEGARDDAVGSLAGVLAKAGWEWKEIERVCRGVLAAAPTEDDTDADEIEHRIDFARRTYEKVRNGDLHVTGFGALVEATGDASAVRQALQWFGIDASDHLELTEFYAHLPDHTYIYEPTGAHWPATSVNETVKWPVVGRDDQGQPVFGKPSTWLSRNRGVQQKTWSPGDERIIEGRLVDQGGWAPYPGRRAFNEYRPPTVKPGDSAAAAKWVELVEKVFPDDVQHILAWFASKVQRPGVKINHALVLSGEQGIGKDSILYPFEHAVGLWNVKTVSPTAVFSQFTAFGKSVVLHVSEVHDLGEISRYAFYEKMKDYTAAPPVVLRCNEKNVKEYYIPNVTGVIYTTNYKATGLYIPPGDRRHYVAWSDVTRDAFNEEYWRDLYQWYATGGIEHVAAYLMDYDLSTFDPKADPPKTAAWHEIVRANVDPAETELTDVLEHLRNPVVVTVEMLAQAVFDMRGDEVTFGSLSYGVESPGAGLRRWVSEPGKYGRVLTDRLRRAGYDVVPNPGADDGRWLIGRRKCYVYGRREVPEGEKIEAIYALKDRRK